ncbi:MAG: outer membrane beta-barrel protein [Pseudolabrys sp.]|nr:outer membrane beta-barrel protein [Pseudolabrys sp.]
MASLRTVLLLAIAAACGTPAYAQVGAKIITVQDTTGALAPPTESDSKTAAKKFQALPQRAQIGPPTSFQLPASGAGDTGFDSSNTKKRKNKTKTKPAPLTATAKDLPAAQPLPLPLPSPKTDDAASKALAQAPGTPPVAFGPITPPPKKRKRQEEADPYAALGVHAGSFYLYPAIELSAGHDSNPGRTPGGPSAGVYTVAPELRAQSDWSRHEFKADLRGSYSWYSPDTTPSLNRPYFNGKADGRVDVTRDTQIDLGARALVSTDNPNSPNLEAGLSRLPVFTTFGGKAGGTHRFNRLEVSAYGDAERTVYQESRLTNGATASNEDRNYNQYAGTVRGAYDVYPGFKPFIEATADTRKHDLAADFSGYRRNSDGLTAKVGSTFDLSRLLTGEVAIGYTQRKYEDPRLSDLKGLIGNGSLTWTPTALTTVKFTASSTVGESSVPGVSGVFYRDLGVQVDHAFRRWLIGTVKAGFGYDVYKNGAVPSGGPLVTACDCGTVVATGPARDRVDQRFSIGAGLTYKLTRQAQVKGEVRHEWLRSNVTGVDYTANIFLVGLRLQL